MELVWLHIHIWMYAYETRLASRKPDRFKFSLFTHSFQWYVRVFLTPQYPISVLGLFCVIVVDILKSWHVPPSPQSMRTQPRHICAKQLTVNSREICVCTKNLARQKILRNGQNPLKAQTCTILLRSWLRRASWFYALVQDRIKELPRLPKCPNIRQFQVNF